MWGEKNRTSMIVLARYSGCIPPRLIFDRAAAFSGSDSDKYKEIEPQLRFAWPGTPSCTTLYMAMWCLTLLLLSARSISQAVFTAISMTIFPFLYRLWDFPAVPASSYYTWQWAGLLVSPGSCWLITDFTWSIDTDAHSTEPLHLCSGSVIT